MYKTTPLLVFSIFGTVLSATVPERNVGRTNSSGSGLDANARQVFVTKTSPDGKPLQRCQCTEFHSCDRGDIYDPSLKQDWIRCDNQVHVCCILKKNEDKSTSVQINKSSQTNTLLFKSSDPETSADDHCTCVTFDKCSNESYVTNYGLGIIGVRNSANEQCEISELCCPDIYIIKNENIKTGGPSDPVETEVNKSTEPVVSVEQPSDPIPPSPSASEAIPSPASDPVPTPAPPSEAIPVETSPNPVQSVTTSFDIEQLFIPTQAPQTQCSCVPIDTCKDESVTNNHGAGLIQVRAPFCDVTEVCCLVSNLIVETAPLSPDPKVGENSTVESSSSEYECGLRKGVITRISNAADSNSDSTYTSFGEFPWMIGILKKGHEGGEPKMICGGSLVSSNTVLTAAHCVHKVDLESLIVRAGEYDFELNADKEQQPHEDRSVQDIRIHPFYREGVVFNDMALLVVDEEFELKSHISPICLPFLNSKFAESDIYDPTKCIAIGWGKEVHGDAGTYQNSLKKVDLSLVDHHECEKKLRKTKLGPKFMLHSSFICAGGEVGKDTCQGDGGGPLFCALRDKVDRYVQVGITSWGVDCGQQYPGVYTNVKANAKWLTVEINVSTIFRGTFNTGVSSKSKTKSQKKI